MESTPPRPPAPPMGMMQLDILLPSQHFGARRLQTPEQRLMIAVLHDALECVQKHRFDTAPRGRRLFDAARRWFLANETDWPYSFECICATLDLDVDAVRQRVLPAEAGFDRAVFPCVPNTTRR